ncbi:MAG: HAD family hydrolase [Ureaplasma sp.]|nr:HAD family hydrolase [Ureaplasma sp.]
MDIKVIATDLDGTLLNNKYWISKKNINALKEFIELGGIVCFITGRSLQSTIEVANLFENKTGYKIHYLSCLKGSILYDNIQNKIIVTNPINIDIAKKIADITTKMHCTFSTYLESDLQNKNMVVVNPSHILYFLHFFRKFKNFIINNNFESIKENNCFKINISNIMRPYLLANLHNELLKDFSNQIEISKTSLFMYEITKLNCNKGIAIEQISKLLNIDLSKIAAFGDSENDIDIFKKVKLSISIGNHSKKLQEIATHSIKFKRAVGVAKGINKFIFNKK